ncbi:MAG: anthranilate phosphoribosyltransferase, partial [Planctomycetes bacterium]|nr:anthranilate phosphoribosyltransferase [Planctomycetota bacterium]
MIRPAIRSVLEGENLSADEAQAVMDEIMSGGSTPAQIAAYLVALRLKGETAEEIAGSARSMREHAVRLAVDDEVVLDTCGTGGDVVGTFNISTASAFVAAGAGVTVAKHGNRSVSSLCGSADVVERLGVNLDVPPVVIEKCLNQVGIGFLYAPALHGAMKYAI